jgi:hypothetical protein
VVGDAAFPGQLPGDALSEEPLDVGGLGGGQEIARSLGPHPVVAGAELRQLRHVIGQVGELVHDRIGLELHNGVTQRIGIVDVADDRLGAERSKLIGLVGRAGHSDDLVSGGHQQWRQPDPDHAACARDEDAHRHRPPTIAPAGVPASEKATLPA